MPSPDISRETPPSPETVRSFISWLKQNGVTDPRESRMSDTRRLTGVESLEKVWAAREGVHRSFPSGRALQIWELVGSAGEEQWKGAGHYDSESGERCSYEGQQLSDTEFGNKLMDGGELDEATFDELSAAFQQAATDPRIRKLTEDKWK